MSSNKNNDLTRCNCYCNNSWTCRILITGHSQPWRHYIVSRECGPGPWPGLLRHGAPVRDPGLLSSDIRGCPVSPRTRQISNVWGEERDGCDEAGVKEGWGFRLPIPRPIPGLAFNKKKTFHQFHLSWQFSPALVQATGESSCSCMLVEGSLPVKHILFQWRMKDLLCHHSVNEIITDQNYLIFRYFILFWHAIVFTGPEMLTSSNKQKPVFLVQFSI